MTVLFSNIYFIYLTYIAEKKLYVIYQYSLKYIKNQIFLEKKTIRCFVGQCQIEILA